MKITMFVRMESPAGVFVRQVEMEQPDDQSEQRIVELANALFKATDFQAKQP